MCVDHGIVQRKSCRIWVTSSLTVVLTFVGVSIQSGISARRQVHPLGLDNRLRACATSFSVLVLRHSRRGCVVSADCRSRTRPCVTRISR